MVKDSQVRFPEAPPPNSPSGGRFVMNPAAAGGAALGFKRSFSARWSMDGKVVGGRPRWAGLAANDITFKRQRDVVAALPDGRRLQPGRIRQSEGDDANGHRRRRHRRRWGKSLKGDVSVPSPSRLPALTRSRVPPEPRRGGRVRPESRRDGRQDPRRRPGQGGAAGGGPRQAAAEQRSQGDPDGGQAAKRRQIIWTPFGLRGPFFSFFKKKSYKIM